MKKLELSQMVCVLGGYNASMCKAVQALAVALSEKVSSNAEWSDWLDKYDKYC
jgi:hypothetical protein